MIERVRTGVQWSSPSWRDEATRLFRRMLVDYVTAYVTEGSAALAEYVDKPAAVRLADETRALVRESPYLKDAAPALVGHLAGTPPAPLPGVRHAIYWAKEEFAAANQDEPRTAGRAR